jgi:hypothetical protein
MCGTACYSNVMSCPTCGARARLARTRGLVQLAMAGTPGLRGRTPGLGGQADGRERTTLRERVELQLRDRTLRAAHEAPYEEIEEEVRERLYGWHSGCVELCDGEDVA